MSEAPVALAPRPPFLDLPAVAEALGALPGARAVGGCVRDAIAGLPSADIDIAAPMPPEEIARRLAASGFAVHETGLSHGTLTVVRHGLPMEVTALRRDVVTDGRHAEVAWTTDWREDAERRDFTINAMSLGPDGVLHDYFSGRADLAAGIVRFVGEADTRLAEDYLRALRFFRFQARYGRGVPDPAAIAAIRRAVPGLARLSAERVWMEIKRILAAPDPVASVALMADTGVLGAVLPEAGDVAAGERHGLAALRRLVAAGAPADPLLRLAALIEDGAKGLAARLALRLRFSAAEGAALAVLLGDESRVSFPPPAVSVEPDMDDVALRRFLAVRQGAPTTDILREAWLAEARDGRDRGALRARIAAAEVPVFPLLGRDLLAEGVPPGPAVGRLLAALRESWLAGGCAATREDMLAEARRRIADGTRG